MALTEAGGNPGSGVIAGLRAQIRRIERVAAVRTATRGGPVDLSPALNAALAAGGLERGALHEIVAAPGAAGAAAGFAAALLGLMAGPVLWCQGRRDAHEAGKLYAPSLAPFGLEGDHLLVVRARRNQDLLWALEEGLRSPALAAVLGEVESLYFTAARRLQLAAEASGVSCLILRPGERALPASAAVTRWRVAADEAGWETAAEAARVPAWRLELLRCRGAAPAVWRQGRRVEWRDGKLSDGRTAAPAHRVALAADVRLRPGEPGQVGAAL
jgi:protein ImuA